MAASPLYHEIHGSGPPLLLIAGLASDSLSWGPVVGPLAERFRVILCDNRGCGRSGHLSPDAGIGDMADDCRLLLDHLGIARAHLLGHSLGGFIAQELALRHPQRVASLLLAATACRTTPRENRLFACWVGDPCRKSAPDRWYREIFRWLFTGRLLGDPERVAALLDAALSHPYPQSGGDFDLQVRAMATFDRCGELAAIGAPALVLAGSEDILFPPAYSAMLARIPGARLTVIGDAAHAIHLEQPGAFSREVAAFLDGLPEPVSSGT